MNSSQLLANAGEEFLSCPMPTTCLPLSFIRNASLAKSPSPVTSTKVCDGEYHRRSMASITIAMSVAFLPLRQGCCCTAMMPFSRTAACHGVIWGEEKFPYNRIVTIRPHRTALVLIKSMLVGDTLSASMSTATPPALRFFISFFCTNKQKI